MFITNNILVLQTDRPVIDTPSTLRGFIGRTFPENLIIHQHLNDGTSRVVYTYPKIQYKVIDGLPIIIGLSNGAKVVETICQKLNQLELKEKIYNIVDKKQDKKELYFGIAKKNLHYKFLTPWLALDEESFNRYRKRNREEKKKQLESILIGNIISMAKGLEYVITDKITATVNVREVPTSLKGTPMLGFLGTFSVNFEIPDYWGIGKSVSRGFGTVIKVNSGQ